MGKIVLLPPFQKVNPPPRAATGCATTICDSTFASSHPTNTCWNREPLTIYGKKINDQMRAFVGMTAFEDLCRQWVIRRAVENDLSFLPDRVSSHWSKKVQVDVMAIRWEGKQIL